MKDIEATVELIPFGVSDLERAQIPGGIAMGKPSTTTHKPVWMFRSDDADLAKLKGCLMQSYGKNITTPDALGVALRLAVKQLEQEAR